MKFDGKKMLIVAPDFPYPPNHGGRADVWGRIQAVSRLGFEIHLVATVKEFPRKEDVDAVRDYARSVLCCARTSSILDLFSSTPYQVKSRDCLASIELDAHYDFVLLETQYVSSILRNPSLSGRQILRIQNDEPAYYRELCRSSRSVAGKLYYFTEALKFKRLDSLLLAKIRNRMFISRDEYAAFVQDHGDMNSVWLPAPPPDAREYDRAPESRTVLFLGSFFMPNNRDAVRWYLARVHSRLLDIDGYSLMLAGNSRGESLGWLHRLTRGDSRISVFDSPDDLSPLYSQSAVFINPMLHGAGVKLKTINAVQNGLPVVTTTVGNQGTGLVPGSHVLVSDDPAGFADHVRDLLLNPCKRDSMARAARQYLEENYDHEAILSRFLSDLLNQGVS